MIRITSFPKGPCTKIVSLFGVPLKGSIRVSLGLRVHARK